jgi:hypothetical protein
VVTPSRILRQPGEPIKTDRRDALKLAGLARGISNVYECAMYLQELLSARRVGFFRHPLEQLKVGVRAAGR